MQKTPALPDKPRLKKSYTQCVLAFSERIDREQNPKVKDALTYMLSCIKEVAREDGIVEDN